MRNDFHELTDRLGRVHNAESGEQMGMGRLTASPGLIALEYLPDDGPRQSGVMFMPPREVPERLVFVDSRGDADAPMELPRKHTLFDYPDIGSAGVKRWVEEADDWARVVGPLVLWHFDRGSSVEVELLQIGVALEALGYKIAVRQGLIQPGGKQSFPQYLKRIGETLRCDVGPVIKGSPANGVPTHVDFEAWSDDFNLLYKQAKHADHPLPEGLRGVIAARSGALLLRMWLAVEFGVDPRTVDESGKYA